MNNNKKVLAVVGAGPMIGMGMARKFGREGYSVALVSRNRQKLDAEVAELQAEGIEAAGFVADVCNRPQLEQTMKDVLAKFGRVDVLEYSPLYNMADLQSALALDLERVQYFLDHQLLGAITATNVVVPGMIERGEGGLLFTTGASAKYALPSHASASMATAALRQYAYMLNMVLASKGVYAGTTCICTVHTGDDIADTYWDMLQKRDRVEEIFGSHELAVSVSCYEEMLWAPGYADTYPRRLIKDPPAPRNDQERRKLLLGLYSMRRSVSRYPQDYPNREQMVNHADELAQSFGGDPVAEYYGAKP